MLYLAAKEMQLNDILYEDVFSYLSKEKQSAIIGSFSHANKVLRKRRYKRMKGMG